MYIVTIQVKQPSVSWDEINKVEHTFKNWKEVSTFAYRLALQMDKEVLEDKEYLNRTLDYIITGGLNFTAQEKETAKEEIKQLIKTL